MKFWGGGLGFKVYETNKSIIFERETEVSNFPLEIILTQLLYNNFYDVKY